MNLNLEFRISGKEFLLLSAFFMDKNNVFASRKYDFYF